ncbi:YceI family protein [Fontimonas sp. SYSU GA230001]|uniref:YceI family protein n=1 Tax=Fontimonas sp. SYSU GA230001 TaxID=3142450 RepID=UPI0032B5CDE5
MKRAAALALLLLAACQAPAPRPAPTSEAAATDWAGEYDRLRETGTAVYRVDPAASDIRIHVYRGGRAAKLGHNHVLSAPDFAGYAAIDGEDLTSARFELRVRFDALSIDDPALRQDTGGAFAGVRSESDITGTRRNMLGPRVLDADHHPELRIRSLRIEGDWPLPIARVAIDWHGVTREQDVLLQVERNDAQLRARGSLVLRQTDYGITPFTILGGAIAVQDAVAVRFDLQARRWPSD